MHIQELGHVVLYVSDLTRMADFYRDTLGFTEITRTHGVAVFGGGRTHHELLLIEIGTPPQPRAITPGLYHIGFKIGDTTEVLKKAYQELRALGVAIVGTGDHTVTHSLYILDPDGNELELYVDVDSSWKDDPHAILAPTKPLRLE